MCSVLTKFVWDRLSMSAAATIVGSASAYCSCSVGNVTSVGSVYGSTSTNAALHEGDCRLSAAVHNNYVICHIQATSLVQVPFTLAINAGTALSGHISA